MSSGVFLFNEPLKDYWEQKKGQPAANSVAEGTGDAVSAGSVIQEQDNMIDTSNAQSRKR